MILGFTGTSHVGGMTGRQQATVRSLFQRLDLVALHHGDCIGADAQAHRIAKHMDVWIVGHPPVDNKARAFCKDFDQLHDPAPYLVRNRHIVQACDGLIGAPKDFHEPKNLRGQGTWTTIGYARQAKKRLWIVFPDGTYKEEKDGQRTNARASR